MNENRGAWYLLTGVIIGLVLGLILSHWVVTVRYANTDPSTLRDKDRQAYRILVAQAYLADGDINRALSRLALLKDKNPSDLIVAQAQNLLASGGSQSQARALALLAAAVNDPSLSVTPLPQATSAAGQVIVPSALAPSMTAGPSGSTSVPAVTSTPGPTGTPRPTSTPMATVGAPFTIMENTKVCDPPQSVPLIEVFVTDTSGQAVAGVKIEISQSGGNPEAFYTGLYPKLGRGYADYQMVPGVSYTIRVGETGQPIPDLTAPSCGVDDNKHEVFGSLKLVFKQP
jgi:protocatechuate 3,4-dioxygenase beta subunit